jgi:outer membrane usher protein
VELDLTLAASQDTGQGGTAAVLVARHVERRASVVGQLRWDSGHYANGSLPASSDRALLRGDLSGSIALAPRLTLLGEIAGERRRDLGRAARGLVRLDLALPRGFSTAASVSRTVQDLTPPSTQVFFSVSMLLPYRTIVEAQAGSGSGGSAGFGQLSATRSLPQGPGIGYRLAARAGDGALAEAELKGQNRYAYGEVLHDELDPFGARRPYTSAQLASSVVLLDGHLYPSRPVEGSYALVRTEGAAGVQVFLQGQDQGRTDSRGDLLVTGLQPYLGNRIAIRDSDLPLDFRVDEVERVVAPRQRGGSVERFRVSRQISVTGRLALVVDGVAIAPEWGEVAVEVPGRRAVSPVGQGGLFWLEAIPPGTHDALLRWEGRLCRFAFEVEKDAAGTVDLGEVRCAQLL